LSNVAHWEERDRYPFAPALAAYSAVTVDAGVIVMGGGYRDNLYNWITTNQVALFNDKTGWRSIGKLKLSRHAHSSILFGNSIFIIGGKGRSDHQASSMSHCQ